MSATMTANFYRTPLLDCGFMTNDFAEWLKQNREQRGITQLLLGDKADTTPATVQRLEAGLRNPSRKMVIRLAEALEADSDTALLAAGFVPDQSVRETPLRYITDPDVADMVEAYEGAADRDKELVKTLLAKAREMEKESSIGGKRSDRDENSSG